MLHGLSQLFYLRLAEITKLTRLQRSQSERSDLYTLELLHEPPGMFKQEPDLVLASLEEPHFVPGICRAMRQPQASGRRAAALDRQAIAKRLFLFGGQRSVDLHEVGLGKVSSRRSDGIGQLAVIGEQQQAFAV